MRRSGLTLGMKLFLAFATVTAFTCALGVWSLVVSARLAAMEQEIYGNWLNGVDSLGKARTTAQVVSRRTALYLLARNNEERAYNITRIEARSKDVEKHLDAYEKSLILDEERQQLADVRAGWAEFQKSMNATIALDNNGKNSKASVVSFYDSVLPNTMKLEAVLTKLSDFNRESAGKVHERSQAHVVALRQQTEIALAVVLIVTVLVGVSLTRTIKKQVGGEPADVMEIANRVAAGDLTVTTTDEGQASIMGAISRMTKKLNEVLANVRSTADSLAAASVQLNSTAQTVAQSSTEQSASAEETSASMEQMSASISKTNENARVTGDIASESAKQAHEGGSAVKETVSAMKQIASKIAIIDDIAYQTNLLALNAAIEAGRAGEHGLGFAVVASEVRKLAERSQVAAEEISGLARGSVELAERAGTLLSTIVPSIQKTAQLVQEIGAATIEQTTGVSQTNAALAQVAQSVQHNATASEELASTSRDVSERASGLQAMISWFKLTERSTPAALPPAPPPQAPKSRRGAEVIPPPPPAGEVSDNGFVHF